MTRIPYEVVFLEVSKLEDKEFPPGLTPQLQEHLDYIRSYIEACGWDTNTFIRWQFHGGNPDLEWN